MSNNPYTGLIQAASTVEELAALHTRVLSDAFGTSANTVYMKTWSSEALTAIMIKMLNVLHGNIARTI